MNNINTTTQRMSKEDMKLIDLYDTMKARYSETILLPTGHYFNQAILVNQILSYLASKFTKKGANKKMRFFNIMRKIRKDFERKTHIRFAEIFLSNDDKALDFLLQAAKHEFADDYNMEQYQLDYTRQNATFGTVVKKIVYRKGVRHIAKIIPFERFICDPVNGDKLPAGEVYQSTLGDIRNNKKYDKERIDAIEEYFRENNNGEYTPNKTSIRLFEIHGLMPASAFEDGAEGMVNGMFILAESDDGLKHILHKSKRKVATYVIDKIEDIFGRTMGYGPMEEQIEYQILTNKNGNSIVNELEATRNYFQTADTGMDGMSLSNVDHNSVINHAEGSPLSVVQSPVQGYAAKASFMNNIYTLSNEAVSSQEQGRGHGAKSNVSRMVQTSAEAEANGTFTFAKDIIFEKQRLDFKRKGGFLDMIMDYFESGKKIERFLSPEKRIAFRKFVALKEAHMEQLRQEQEDLLYIMPEDALLRIKLEESNGKKLAITFEDGEIDREQVIDYTYLTYGAKDDMITNKVASLERLHNMVKEDPDRYPSYNLDSIAKELETTLSISGAMNQKVNILQTGQAAVTPATNMSNAPINNN